jgi:hypothetical protein
MISYILSLSDGNGNDRNEEHATMATYTFTTRPGCHGFVYATRDDGAQFEVYLQGSIDPMVEGQARLTDPDERAALLAQARAYALTPTPAAAPAAQDAPQATAPRALATIQAERATLTQTARRYQAGANEGGDGYNPHAAALRALRAEEDAVQAATAEARVAALQEAKTQEWTREVTIARRAAWNTWVKSHGKTITPAQVAAQIHAQGWTIDDLKTAITRHSL